ncbi:MAG: hypothetical protein JWO05_1466 [Gemmatimonadetes bacterium]|nr:hypothetical protein [Gemmatimonadota bacterium]
MPPLPHHLWTTDHRLQTCSTDRGAGGNVNDYTRKYFSFNAM